jgi:hypothetical protein
VGTQGQFTTLSDSIVEGGSGLVLVLDTILDDDHTVGLVLDVMESGERSLCHLTPCNLPNHLHICLLGRQKQCTALRCSQQLAGLVPVLEIDCDVIPEGGVDSSLLLHVKLPKDVLSIHLSVSVGTVSTCTLIVFTVWLFLRYLKSVGAVLSAFSCSTSTSLYCSS